MPRFTTRLIDRTEVADGTLAFAFERPAGFEFTAGQYLTITLPDPLYNDEKGNSRTFSIASPPQDAGRLVIATRMTGSALEAQPGRGAARHAGEHLRPGGRLHARPGPDPGGVHRRRHRHHAVSQHAARCRGARAAAPDHAHLLEPHAGGRAVPRGAGGPGQDVRGLPLRADDDGAGQVGAALGRRAAIRQCGVPARPRRGHDRADLLSRRAARARRRRHQDRARGGSSAGARPVRGVLGL